MSIKTRNVIALVLDSSAAAVLIASVVQGVEVQRYGHGVLFLLFFANVAQSRCFDHD